MISFCKQITHVLILSFASIFNASANTNDWYSDNQMAIDSIRKGNFKIQITDANGNPIDAEISYKLVKHEFPWGTALSFDGSNDDDWYKAMARKYFNSGVFENAFKWSSMQPTPGVVNYTDVDNYLAWANEAGWEIRGHTLLWGSKNYEDTHPLMKWVKDLPTNEIIDECELRVKREMEYYKGVIKEYDVMNEAVSGHADWLQRTVGDSINWNSFKWAREADSTAKLYINDYSIITGGSYLAYIDMIKEMLANGAPIDGIGVQSHFGRSFSTTEVTRILNLLAELELPIKITEFDMLVGQYNLSETKQAEYYAKAMRTCFAHPSVNGFIFWGFWDKRHWRDEAGIFTSQKTPKIAADSVYNLIHTTWHTEGEQSVVSNTLVDINAYYGTYEFTVNYANEARVIKTPLFASNTNDTVKISINNGELPAPKLISATAYDEKNILLQFDSKMLSNENDKNNFRIFTSTNQSIDSLWQPVNDSTIVMLTLNSKLNNKNYITASYFPGRLAAENKSNLEFFGNIEVKNLVPSFISGSTSMSGDSIIVQFSQALTEPEKSSLQSFYITADDNELQVNDIGLISSDSTKIYLILAENILVNERIKLTYTPGNLISVYNGKIGAFGPKLITNKVAVDIPEIYLDKANISAYYKWNEQKIILLNASDEDCFFTLYNISGQTISTGNIKAKERVEMNANHLSKGLVLVKYENKHRSAQHNIKLIIK